MNRIGGLLCHTIRNIQRLNGLRITTRLLTTEKPTTKPRIDDQEYKYEPPKPQRKVTLLTAKSLSDVIMIVIFGTICYLLYKKQKEKKAIERDADLIANEHFKYRFYRKKDSVFMLPEFLVKKLNDFKMFKTRNDDIWIVSFPKSDVVEDTDFLSTNSLSLRPMYPRVFYLITFITFVFKGTTWLQEIVYLIMNNCDYEKAQSDTIERRVPFFEYETPGLSFINNQPATTPRILKTHLPKAYLPDDIESKSKVIYIARNPKDVAVSYFNFVKMSTQAGYTGEINEFLEEFMQGTGITDPLYICSTTNTIIPVCVVKVPYGPWWNHVDEYLNSKNVYVVYYEDLQTKPFETVKDICKFLGKELTDDQLTGLIKWCSYDSMKSNSKVNYEWYKEYGLFKKDGHFLRKGIIGDWLNVFNPDVSKRFDDCIEENLKTKVNFNYGISDESRYQLYEAHKNKNKNSK